MISLNFNTVNQYRNCGISVSLSGGGSRPGHRVSGIRSKFPNLNENGQKSHFLRGFSDSEPGQHFFSRSVSAFGTPFDKFREDKSNNVFREILKHFRKTAKCEFFAKQIIYLESPDHPLQNNIYMFVF